MATFEVRPAEGTDGFKGELVVSNSTGSVMYEVDLHDDGSAILVDESEQGFHVDVIPIRR